MAFLSYKEIIELIDKVADSGIGAVEIESSGTRVRIEGMTYHESTRGNGTAVGGVVVAEALKEPAPETEKPALPVPQRNQEGEIDSSWHIVTSPIVGTFYMSPNPEADSFVSLGDRVSKGDVLCIVEAMKLMNEIESDSDGEIVKIFPRNAQPIEYGEKLFALKP